MFYYLLHMFLLRLSFFLSLLAPPLSLFFLPSPIASLLPSFPFPYFIPFPSLTYSVPTFLIPIFSSLFLPSLLTYFIFSLFFRCFFVSSSLLLSFLPYFISSPFHYQLPPSLSSFCPSFSLLSYLLSFFLFPLI